MRNCHHFILNFSTLTCYFYEPTYFSGLITTFITRSSMMYGKCCWWGCSIIRFWLIVDVLKVVLYGLMSSLSLISITIHQTLLVAIFSNCSINSTYYSGQVSSHSLEGNSNCALSTRSVSSKVYKIYYIQYSHYSCSSFVKMDHLHSSKLTHNDFISILL